jgi:indole-3-glycerol phosphate synthase
MSLLEDLLARARERSRQLPRDEPGARRTARRFDEAIRGKDGLGVVAEFKQASPSLGPIARRDVVSQVKRYVEAGAAAVSVLTEPSRFGGAYEHLRQAAEAVEAPILMKDFVVAEAQVRWARCLGASAVLLVARALAPSQLRELASACDHYGVVPLVECHDPRELDVALDAPTAVIGANNRDLETLEVHRGRALLVLREVPRDRVTLAESGYQRPEDTRELRGLADAVLIGSALMKEEDPAPFIAEVIV